MASTSLIIGESHSRRHIISKIIESTQIFSHIGQSSDGQEALKRLKNHSVDVIFYGAEKLSSQSFKWLKQLNKQVESKNIPVFIFSSEENEKERIMGLESGASDCLTYEISAKEAAARIRRSLETKKRIEQLRKANDELERQAMTDPLTGLCNRRFFALALESEAARSSRTEEPFSLLILDLDHFKKINDRFGHQAGDAVLQVVASTLRTSIRKFDTACRYGGEEFAIIMPGTTSANSYRIAERIRKKIASLSNNQLPINVPVTVSIGICCAAEPNFIDCDKMILEADYALYRAKRRGRNLTEIFKRTERIFPSDVLSPDFAAPFAQIA
jgi:diguanylate cyclase (GGDEF)-like protein